MPTTPAPRDTIASFAERVALLPNDERTELLRSLFTDHELALIAEQQLWEFWARPQQLPPGHPFSDHPDPADANWRYWLVLAGRGWGKTRTGAEWVYHRIRNEDARYVALIGPTVADTRDTMVEGPAGIMNAGRPEERPEYFATKRKLVFPNGAEAHTYSADEPDRLRGPQHDTAWADEPAAWRYAEDCWDMLMFGLRLGNDPKVIGTTTPRPIPLVKRLINDEHTHVTTGTTYDNVQNLAEAFKDAIIKRYEGTRLGRQELMAEILDDNPRALWHRHVIDKARTETMPQRLTRIVVAVDPAVNAETDHLTDELKTAETGIVVAGMDRDGQAYVLEDMTIRASPDTWAKRVVHAYRKWNADRVVAEVNNGGDLVEYVLRAQDDTLPIRKVRASRGKLIRAEPVAALYEQGRVHHVGYFHELEDQLCEWEPGMASPDRMDALVWAMTELLLNGNAGTPLLAPVLSGQNSYWRQAP